MLHVVNAALMAHCSRTVLENGEYLDVSSALNALHFASMAHDQRTVLKTGAYLDVGSVLHVVTAP